MLPNPPDLAQLRDALRQFADERDWDQFHSPKNLASALAVEAAELLERFQWLTEDESRKLPPAELARVREEMADVLNYLVRLADKLDVNLLEAARDKIKVNALKYPADKARGSARKYSEMLDGDVPVFRRPAYSFPGPLPAARARAPRRRLSAPALGAVQRRCPAGVAVTGPGRIWRSTPPRSRADCTPLLSRQQLPVVVMRVPFLPSMTSIGPNLALISK